MKKLSFVLIICGLSTLFFGGITTTSASTSGHLLKEACTIEYSASSLPKTPLKDSYDFGNLIVKFGTFCAQSGFWINEKPFIDTLGIIDINITGDSLIFITTGMKISCDKEKLASFWPKKATSLSLEAKETLAVIATLPNSSPYELAEGLGYSRKTDRFLLAREAGIKNYRGTASQNLKIQEYLLIKKGVLPADGTISKTETQDITINPLTYAKMKQENVSNLVQHWDYYWPLHRKGLAKEFIPAVTEQEADYQGSRSQNTKIGSELLKRVDIRKE